MESSSNELADTPGKEDDVAANEDTVKSASRQANKLVPL
jgi:hypothetical protein